MNKNHSDYIEAVRESLPTVTMTAPRFKTQWNAELFPAKYAVNSQPSMTIPDQTMTVKQIMDRYAHGLDPIGQKVPMYYGEDEQMEMDINRLDLSERYQWIAQNRIRMAELRDRLQNPDKYKEQEIPFEEVKTDPPKPDPKPADPKQSEQSNPTK